MGCVATIGIILFILSNFWLFALLFVVWLLFFQRHFKTLLILQICISLRHLSSSSSGMASSSHWNANSVRLEGRASHLLNYFKKLNADAISRSQTRRLADSAASLLSSGLTWPERISESNVISMMHFVSAVICWNNCSFNTLHSFTIPAHSILSLQL